MLPCITSMSKHSKCHFAPKSVGIYVCVLENEKNNFNILYWNI